MTKRLALAALAVIAAAASVGPAGAAVTRDITEEYLGSSTLTIPGMCQNSTIPVNIGKACFDIRSGEESVRITVNDQVTGGAGFFYIQSDSSGACVGANPDPASTEPCPGAGIHCGDATIAILPGAVELEVWISGAEGPLDCVILEASDSAGTGFVGTVRARFRN